MFRIKIYASPENFKPLLEGMKVTFRRDGAQQHHLFLTVSFHFTHFILHLKVTLKGQTNTTHIRTSQLDI